MNKKTTFVRTLLIAIHCTIATVANAKLANPAQKGSLLIFPHIESKSAGNATDELSDTLVNITNDAAQSVNVQCYWATTKQQDDSHPLGAGGNIANKWARHAIRNNYYIDFSFKLAAHRAANFWANDLSMLYALPPAKKVFTGGWEKRLDSKITNVPQFNFSPDGWANAKGALLCWAVNKNGSGEIHHNHLIGKATTVSFAPYSTEAKPTSSGQAYEYNAWSFQAYYQGSPDIKHTGKTLGTTGSLDLNGKKYDQCPSALAGQFTPTYRASGKLINKSHINLSNCHQDIRQDAFSHITKLIYTVWDDNDTKYTGAQECMGAWYESDLGKAFPHFTYKTLKTDTAYFRVQPSTSKQCADSDGNASDVETSGIIGVQINDIGGLFQTSNNLTGLGAGTNDVPAVPVKDQILWDPTTLE